MARLELTIVTPERTFFNEEVDSVHVPGEEGDIGVYDNHSPLISTIKSGIVEIVDKEALKGVFISKGFIEIQDNKVNIIADFVESVDEINVDRAEKAKKRAEERLAKKKDIDLKRANEALERAELRLKLAIQKGMK